jgi:BirA family transcriptional regulator, biotin operon repressor / biotin---[acetyl-CoA-carboxylase] ligase
MVFAMELLPKTNTLTFVFWLVACSLQCTQKYYFFTNRCIMPTGAFPFTILMQVDSTNNYAMASVHEGLAKHGNAVFSHSQMQGKGQRGKEWHSGTGENIALSVILDPELLGLTHPFQLSLTIALASYDFFSNYAGEETSIKWPNDIYWRDRKAAGVLIENVISGKKWKWAVAGIGVNINQTSFNAGLRNPVSLKQVTGKSFDTLQLAKELHQRIMVRTSDFSGKAFEGMLSEYNQCLFKRNAVVKLKKGNTTFETMIKGVSPTGQLETRDVIDRQFEFGEVEWLL